MFRRCCARLAIGLCGLGLATWLGCGTDASIDDPPLDASASVDAPGQVTQDHCQVRTCAQAHAQCGAIDDGCGGSLECGECETNQRCQIEETSSRCVRACPVRANQRVAVPVCPIEDDPEFPVPPPHEE